MDNNGNVVKEKSEKFAIRIVNLYKHLTSNKDEKVMAKQLLRSGTSIGANISESVYAASLLDFISKMQIALKEAGETIYWLELLHNTGYLTDSEFNSISNDCNELIKLLTSLIVTNKSKQ